MILENRYHIFIAYASPDRPYAKSLYEILREDYEVFFDEESLLPGDPWDITLPRSQANSLITIILISENVDDAYYQKEEIASAIALARDPQTLHRVIPIYLDDSATKESVPYGLRRLHSIYLGDNFTIADAANAVGRVLKEMPHAEIYRRSPVDVHKERLKAITDAKTDREKFETRVDNQIQIHNEIETKSSMIYIDLDGFSGLNKCFGISVGNEVVKVIGKIVNDLCGNFPTTRWGGDSFLFFLQVKEWDEVFEIAESIRQKIHSYDWETIAPRLYVNASIGVAELRNESRSKDLILRAKEGARLAKKQGGNRIMKAPLFLGPNFMHSFEIYDLIDS